MSGAESHHDLVAYERGELAEPVAAEVSAHVAACAACAAELVEIRRVMDDVRADALAPSAAFRARLDAVLDVELARGPAGNVISLRSRVRELWEFAQWRYENSIAVRRFVAASLIAHAAAVAAVAFLLVGGGSTPAHDVDIAWERLPEPPVLVQDDPPARLDGDPIVDSALAPAMARRLTFVLDTKARDAHLAETLGELAPQVTGAMEAGLDWLADEQHEDGTWGAPQAGTDVRVGTTAAVVTAFTVNGIDAPLESRALGYLERYLEGFETADAPDFGDEKPVYAYALALRALLLADAADHEYRAPGTLATLGRYAARLARWQRADGGFGYTPDAERSDSSCTLFAAETLDWVRAAGLRDTTEALERAGRFLAARRGDDGVLGYEATGDRSADLGLTASLEALGPAVGVPSNVAALAAIETALARPERRDLFFYGQAVAALARTGRSLESPVTALLAARGEDGSWDAHGDRHCASGGSQLATALGVVGLARTYVN